MTRNWQIVHLMNLKAAAKRCRWTKQMLVEIKRTQAALLASAQTPAAASR